jgi:hypothetical protein
LKFNSNEKPYRKAMTMKGIGGLKRGHTRFGNGDTWFNSAEVELSKEKTFKELCVST